MKFYYKRENKFKNILIIIVLFIKRIVKISNNKFKKTYLYVCIAVKNKVEHKNNRRKYINVNAVKIFQNGISNIIIINAL